MRLADLKPKWWAEYRDHDQTPNRGGFPTGNFGLTFICPDCGPPYSVAISLTGGAGERSSFEPATYACSNGLRNVAMHFGRVLVTGATGWLGPYVVAALKASGNEVVAADRRLLFEGRFQAVIHLAPSRVTDIIDRAVEGVSCPLLISSSGATTHKSSTYRGGYALDKLADEALIAHYPQRRIARIYSVLGPGIPIDAHYAASSFLRQAVAGGPVVVRDGAIRSYLHPADVASALLTILAHGDGEPYDVGGEVAIEVAELGKQIAVAAGVACHLAQPEFPKDIYLPNLTRLHRLGWRQTIGLDAMIADTLASLKAPA